MRDPERLFKEFSRIESIFGRDVDLAAVEEAGRAVSEHLSSEVEERPVKRTHIVDKRLYGVVTKYDVIHSSSRGRLLEFTVRSPTRDFNVFMQADGRVLLDRDYEALAVLSPQSSYLDAYEEADGGIYTVHLSEIAWYGDYLLSIYVSEPTILENIWAVFETEEVGQKI